MQHLANLPYPVLAILATLLLATLIFGRRLIVKIGLPSNDYMPATDTDLDAWQQNFYTLVAAGPATYGLDAAAATALQPLSVAFTADLATATNPITRSKVTVASKDAAKAALKSFLRSLASIVQATVSVTNDAKVALGLPIHDSSPSPIPAPVTHPVLGIAPVGPGQIVRRYADQLTPSSVRKPAGAAGLLVACKVSATPITNPDDLTDSDYVTRQPNYKSFDSADRGKFVYTAAKWITARGLEGPWSEVSINVVP